MTPQDKIRHIYRLMMAAYGPQGWWPVPVHAGDQKTRCDARGYHPGFFDIPVNEAQQLEIALGAVLTQNTAWKNAAAALRSLANSGLLSLEGLQKAKSEQISLAIRSAGYYNQKTKTVRNLVFFLQRNPFRELASGDPIQVRNGLLGIGGIGPETADCILLYALKQPCFVVDAYTRRILAATGVMPERTAYEGLRCLFETSLGPEVAVYQEYHALLVRHGKAYYSRRPHGKGDLVLEPGGMRH